MATEDTAPIIQIKVRERTYSLDFDEISGRDAQEFAAVVGVPLAAALDPQYRDLHVLAGLVWLARRRHERKLRYETVNMELTYGMMRRGELDIIEPDDEDDESNGQAPEPDPPQ